MSRGVIIHLDNDRKTILDPAKNLFDQYATDLEYITCESKEEFEAAVENHANSIKALIFDLLSEEASKEELEAKDAEFLEKIRSSFADYNIPVFIYSGYLEAVKNEFEYCGTVYKFDKDQEIKLIFDKILFLYKSGFIEIFSPGGILEKELHVDLHKAFTKQFSRNEQIENIINGIIDSSQDENEVSQKGRIQRVFKRVAIRSLLSGLLEPEVDEDGYAKSEFLNPVEHYLFRISSFDFWTGDIFEHNENSEMILILTPRCNVASSKFTELLICQISEEFPSGLKSRKDRDKVANALTDNPTYSGYDRFLPPSPTFRGGKVILSSYRMISKEDLNSNFKRIVTLSDELTNEILGKFGAYFFRTGINPWSMEETVDFIGKTQEQNAEKE